MAVVIDLITSFVILGTLLFSILQFQIFVLQGKLHIMGMDQNHAYSTIYRTILKSEISLIGLGTDGVQSIQYASPEKIVFSSRTSYDNKFPGDRKITTYEYVETDTIFHEGRLDREMICNSSTLNENMQFSGISDLQFLYFDASGDTLFPSTNDTLNSSERELIRFVGFKAKIISQLDERENPANLKFITIEERVLLKNIWDFGAFTVD